MDHTPTSISISTDTFIRAIIIGAVAYVLWILRGLVLLLVTAVVIASAIEPGVALFTKRHIPRVIAVLIMYLVVFGTLFSMAYFFLPPILEDAQSFIASVPQYLDTFNIPNSLSATSDTPLLSGTKAGAILNSLLVFRSAFVDPSEGVIRLVSTFFGGIFSLVLVIVLSFYFAVQDTGFEDFLRTVTPAKHEAYAVDLWYRARKKIGLWMQGQLLSSILGAVIAYLGLLILGVKYALLLAVFTAIAMLVPIFGSFLAALPAILVAFSASGVPVALIVAGLYLIINQFEAHLIHPLVVNKVVGIPPLLVIIALIAGGTLAGFLGVLLAIPLAATLREFLTDFARGKRKSTS